MRLLANAKTKHILFLATASLQVLQTLTMSLHKIPILDFMIIFFFPSWRCELNSELVSQGSCGRNAFQKLFLGFNFFLLRC